MAIESGKEGEFAARVQAFETAFHRTEDDGCPYVFSPEENRRIAVKAALNGAQRIPDAVFSRDASWFDAAADMDNEGPTSAGIMGANGIHNTTVVPAKSIALESSAAVSAGRNALGRFAPVAHRVELRPQGGAPAPKPQ
ncbi:hypothetical protein HYS97_02905 [Candidatus Daviesbacteria bacterium]|nr:hypothetical protein [Candidatus Daviesbacteria bacterium]